MEALAVTLDGTILNIPHSADVQIAAFNNYLQAIIITITNY